MFCYIVAALVVGYLFIDWFIRVFKISNYSNRHVLVTGCDSGFGRDLVIRLDKLGFPVFAGCFTDEGRRSLPEICSSRVEVFPLDVTRNESIQEAVAFVRRRLPDGKGLWGVVNNAGVIGQVVAAEMCTKKDHQDCYDVNLIGPIEMSRVFLPFLRKTRGRLVNVTSCVGRTAFEAAPYSVSKFGLEAYSDVVRREVSQFGVKISMIEPGYTQTSLFHVEEKYKAIRQAFADADPDVQAAYGKNYPEQAIAVFNAKMDRLSPHRYKTVDAIINALTSVYPRPRYVVGKDARFLWVPMSLLPEWIVDWFLISMEKRFAKEKGFVFQ